MNSIAEHKIFTPFTIGRVSLRHRVVMAPLTRLRSEQPGDVPGPLMAQYYEQRTSPGRLIITESAEITPEANAYEGAPGIYSEEQVTGWSTVTEAIHRKGALSFCSFGIRASIASRSDWRASSKCLGDRKLRYPGLHQERPVTCPAEPGFADSRVARNCGPLSDCDHKGAGGWIRWGRSAGGGRLSPRPFFAERNQFANRCVYGGSVENRARLLLEVVEAVTEIFSRDRVGVRLSPSGIFNGISDSNPEVVFDYVAGALNRFGLAYLHVIEPRVKGGETLREGHPPVAAARLRKVFNGPMIAAGGFDREGAMEVLDKGDADLVAFGRHSIANPDLVERFRLGLPLNRYDRSTFYSPGPKGYIDYATHTDLANPFL